MAGMLLSHPVIWACLLYSALLFIGAIWEGGASAEEGRLRAGAGCPDHRHLPELGLDVSDQIAWRLPGVSPSSPLARRLYASGSAYYRAKFAEATNRIRPWGA
jgi:hypothetical protein